MPQLFIAIAIVVGGLWLIRKMARTPHSAMPGLMQKVAGGALIGLSAVLALRGGGRVAVPLFVTGLGLLGKSTVFPNGFPWGAKRSPGQKSEVATSQLSMQLDHDTGSMAGTVLAGPYRNRALDSLSTEQLQGFRAQCEASDGQSVALLEAWLDRNRPGWRESWGGQGRSSSGGGSMSRAEALNVLGLKDGATVGDVKAAHKRLMKEFHPDRGGSDYLAAKINMAKDVLIGT